MGNCTVNIGSLTFSKDEILNRVRGIIDENNTYKTPIVKNDNVVVSDNTNTEDDNSYLKIYHKDLEVDYYVTGDIKNPSSIKMYYDEELKREALTEDFFTEERNDVLNSYIAKKTEELEKKAKEENKLVLPPEENSFYKDSPKVNYNNYTYFVVGDLNNIDSVSIYSERSGRKVDKSNYEKNIIIDIAKQQKKNNSITPKEGEALVTLKNNNAYSLNPVTGIVTDLSNNEVVLSEDLQNKVYVNYMVDVNNKSNGKPFSKVKIGDKNYIKFNDNITLEIVKNGSNIEYKRADSNILKEENKTNDYESPKTIDEDNNPFIFDENKPVFEYKGVKINTKFQLSDEQETALKDMIKSYDKGNRTFMITGKAGVGKSSIVKYFGKYLSARNKVDFNSRTLNIVPTHKAGIVIENISDIKYKTISSFFSGKDKEGHPVMPKFINEMLGNMSGNIFIFDEISMAVDNEFTALFNEISKDNNNTIILMGDEKQLTPVNNVVKNDEKQINIGLKGKLTDLNINLTQVQRTKDNTIVDVLNDIRDNNLENLPNTRNTESYKEVKDKNDLLQTYVNNKTNNPNENHIVITYNQDNVKKYNNEIRNRLGFTENKLYKGEEIVGYPGVVGSKSDPRRTIGNSVSYTIKSKETIDSQYSVPIHGELITVTSKDVDLKTPLEFVFLPITTNDFEVGNTKATEEQINNNSEFYKKLLLDFKRVNEAIEPFIKERREVPFFLINEKKGILDKIGRFQFSRDVILDGDKIVPYEKGNERHEKIKKKTPEFFVEKGFDFNYAISTVKSQGSTYDNVYYDASIKTQEYKTKVMNDEKEIGSVISSLHYTALSRARNSITFFQPGNLRNSALLSLFGEDYNSKTKKNYNQKSIILDVDLNKCF